MEINNLATDNPKLRGRKLKNGQTISLFLEYYYGHEYVLDQNTGKFTRKKHSRSEWLSLYVTDKPKTAAERSKNCETIRLAQAIQQEKIKEMQSIKHGEEQIRYDNYFDYMQDYYDNYEKADKSHFRRAIKTFKDYLGEQPAYLGFTIRIAPEQITKRMLEGYAEYLLKKFAGEGPHSLWQRFKKMMKHAFQDGIMTRNLCDGIVVPCKGSVEKDVLTKEELVLLENTHYAGEKDVIRRAFLFSAYTGLRFCDVRAITYSNIKGSTLEFIQQKTGDSVSVPLSPRHLNYIKLNQSYAGADIVIFDLPSDTTCGKELKKWVKAAGIDKHITWHCARHSFGTNLASDGTDMNTIKSLLGHSSLKHTERYVRAADKLKEKAMYKLTH